MRELKHFPLWDLSCDEARLESILCPNLVSDPPSRIPDFTGGTRFLSSRSNDRSNFFKLVQHVPNPYACQRNSSFLFGGQCCNPFCVKIWFPIFPSRIPDFTPSSPQAVHKLSAHDPTISTIFIWDQNGYLTFVHARAQAFPSLGSLLR
jgi:hypothetical protein